MIKGIQRNKNNKLVNWEIALVKRMIKRGGFPNQTIHAYFTRPNRTINQARISDIRTKKTHVRVKLATDEQLDAFLADFPQIDWETGLHLVGDERLIKAREALLSSIQIYNNPRSFFRSELFIVGAVIAWTYLMHAIYEKSGVDIRYYENKEGKQQVKKTKSDGDCFWELSQCLKAAECPIDEATKSNLEFLIRIRNEIEHRMTGQIDDLLGAKFQATCENFNRYICEFFGDEMNLGKELSFSLQFSAISLEQQRKMGADSTISRNFLDAQKDFERDLKQEIYDDERYAFRVALVPKTKSNKSTADRVVEFVKAEGAEAEEIQTLVFKDVERPKFRAGEIVTKATERGHAGFRIYEHTQLWKKLDAKNATKGYGVEVAGTWYWYQKWLDRVLEELGVAPIVH